MASTCGKLITSYIIETFDTSRAMAGGLCVMTPTSNSILSCSTINSIDSNFKGAGICRYKSPNSYFFTVDSVTYCFDSSGAATSMNAIGYKLWSAKLNTNSINTILKAGNRIKALTKATVNLDSNCTTIENCVSNITVASLNARDEFAAQALRGILAHIDDPSSLSNSEINHYCNAAYEWAANMMSAAASARAGVTGASDAGEASIDSSELDTTNERLLNNIVVALERTDYRENTYSSQPFWYHLCASVSPVYGMYCDYDVRNNLRRTDPTTQEVIVYNTIQEAEADNWTWNCGTLSKKYSERIINPTLNCSLAELKQVECSKLANINTALSNLKSTNCSKLDAIADAIDNIDISSGTDVSGIVEKLDNIKCSVTVLNCTISGKGTSSSPMYISGGGGGGGGSTDVSGIVTQLCGLIEKVETVNTTISNKGTTNNTFKTNTDVSGSIDIGDTGLGNSISNPIYNYISGVLDIGNGGIGTSSNNPLYVSSLATVADDSITTAKIHDSAVTAAKIACSTITNRELANCSVINAKIANSTIEASKINPNIGIVYINKTTLNNLLKKLKSVTGIEWYASLDTNSYNILTVSELLTCDTLNNTYFYFQGTISYIDGNQENKTCIRPIFKGWLSSGNMTYYIIRDNGSSMKYWKMRCDGPALSCDTLIDEYNANAICTNINSILLHDYGLSSVSYNGILDISSSPDVEKFINS